MPSEGRLHPLSIFFGLAKQASGLAIPLLMFLIGSRSGGFGWELVGLFFLIPSALVAVGRYFTFRYRYETEEMVIRSGFLFRSERHVPYARIQNVEAVQNVFHRLFGVVEVRVQTAGADEPEATMTVLPMAALEEMRQRVATGRQGTLPTAPAAAGESRHSPVVFALSIRELLLSGFIENRGLIVVGAALGLMWELNLDRRFFNYVVGEEVSGRGVARAAVRSFLSGAQTPWTLLWLAGLVVAFLMFTRVLSMGWALIRLHGFTVRREGNDLRIVFGLFTRLTTTIPLRRIQQVTVRQTPLHRLFGRASVRVATAGGAGQDGPSSQREWLAPIIRPEEVPRLLQQVLPEVEVQAFEWRPVHPRAFSRAVKVSLAMAGVACVASLSLLRWWVIWAAPIYAAIAIVQARLSVANLGWAITGNAVAFRRGAFWRYVSIARFGKIQAVSMHESPFDRRTGMATLAVDTAGTAAAYQVAIPYLGREVAEGLRRDLAASAGRTAFRW